LPNVKIDNETYNLLVKLKYEAALKGTKTSFSELIRHAVFETYGKTVQKEKRKVKVRKVEEKQPKEDEDVSKLIREAVESVDAQKTKISMGKIEVRETRLGTCPSCGNIGTPIMALYTGNWIHRLLVECDECGEKYVSYLGKNGLRHISEFDKLKEKCPNCKLVKYEDFLKKYKVIRGIHEE